MEGLQSIHIIGKDIEFSLIEDKTIDIDSIEEFSKADDIDWCYPCNENIQKLGLKINELVQAVKHLNKEIQSIKR